MSHSSARQSRNKIMNRKGEEMIKPEDELSNSTFQVSTLFVIAAEISKAVSAAMQLKFALRRALR